jgi:hypothetical protein
MDSVVKALHRSFPQLHFTAADTFCWSPETREVFYDTDRTADTGVWSLLHETGHALLDHASYKADFELIRLEVDAWEKAKELATDLAIVIDEEHIQDCIDTYRDWLYRRSICPSCNTKCLQESELAEYYCFNCHETWGVTPSRFCRAYRAKKVATRPSPVFQLIDDSTAF